MAENHRQYLIPGYGYIDEKNEARQWLIPGYGYMNERAPDFIDFAFEAIAQSTLVSATVIQSSLINVTLIN